MTSLLLTSFIYNDIHLIIAIFLVIFFFFSCVENEMDGESILVFGYFLHSHHYLAPCDITFTCNQSKIILALWKHLVKWAEERMGKSGHLVYANAFLVLLNITSVIFIHINYNRVCACTNISAMIILHGLCCK